MPLTRYQIRNEFSLADPELYRTADGNDPEALLEGVAMAGLVGVLRQLGDLAEFAAEIFHDLHEELMATAARGHGLSLRVQQLEAEVPSIEKAFLSQTTHSSFVHNAGIDWHPNLRVDQNLITQGDLPRFVMDSYEECRGPPRLFLLDKFDIAGAGACLKRYSDPSFFRADLTTKATKEEVKRDKRDRKVKKKVPRWKNVETPELASSHSKLHQLFTEEHQRSENIMRNHHVKLKKRQSNSSYADAATGRSYMERFLPSSPEKKSVSQRFSSPSHLKMEISNFGELVPSHEIPSNSAANKLVTRDESSVPPQTAQEKALDPSSNEPSEDVIEEENMKKPPESTTDVELDGISPTLHKAENTKELVLCSERNSDVNGYLSDDATSEMENYVDAPATIESEMETDSESRPKNEHRVMINKKLIDFGGNGEQKELHDNFSDSHSRGSSIASYDQDSPMKKGRSISFYSESSSNSAENVTSDGNLAAKLRPYPHDEVSYSSPKMTSAMGNDLGSKSEKYVVPDSTFSEAPSNPSNYVSQFREESYNSEVTNSTPGSCDSSSGVSLKEVQPSGLKSSEVSSRHMNSAVGESSSRTEIDGGNRKDDLLSSNNVFKNSSELRWYSPSVGSQQIQSLEMLGGENPDIFSLAGEETGNDLAGEETGNDHVATFEARSLSDDANDNQTKNLVNGKTDSTVMPESILDSPADVNLSDARSDGIVMEAGSVTQTAESSECSTLVIDRPATDDFGEQKHREMADQAPPLEWDSAEIVNAGNELEPSCSDLESIDEFGADRVSLDSPTTKRKVDVSTERNISDAQDLVSAEENHLHVHGLEAENVCTDDGENAKGDHMPTGSLCSDQIELQECQPSSEDSDKRKLEIIEVSNLNDVVCLDAKDEAENQPQGAPSNSNIDIVEDTQDHLQHSDGTDAPLLKETDHDLESKQATQLSAIANDMSSSIHLSEPGLPLEQGLESEAEEDNMPYNQEVNENSNPFYHQYEQSQSQKKIESNECSNALPMSSSVESLSQQSDLNLPYQSKTYEPSMVPSQQVSHDFDVPSEATIQVLGTSLPDHNVLAASPEEMPPLPPLPPVQWRIGKLHFGFPSSEGESAQHSLNPLLLTSAEAADERTQQGFPTFSGEVVQPLSPFSLNPSPDDKMIEHSSEMLGRETSQTSPSTSSSPLPVFSQEKIQQDSFTSHRTEREPLNPFSPLSDEEPRHDSSDFGELLDPSHMNLLAPAPAPAVDDSSTRHVSSTSQKELEQSLDLSACIPNKEDEKLHDNLSSKHGTKEPQSSFTPPTIENEESRHDSWSPEGEREWQSNLPIFMPPTAEDGKPNGTKKSWLIRPRSPLIEAVASHDKSNLRKVTERVLPQTEPKADERNSLLEQIRTKSFNLKPASLTRPSIKGPETNLKVVAILEKANAIRQALAGSDEDDDEESWSDS